MQAFLACTSQKVQASQVYNETDLGSRFNEATRGRESDLVRSKHQPGRSRLDTRRVAGQVNYIQLSWSKVCPIWLTPFLGIID